MRKTLTLFIILMILIVPVLAVILSQTQATAGAAASAAPGTQAWSGPTNAEVLDGTNATVSSLTNVVTSETLSITSYGFTIPGSATIVGVEVDPTSKRGAVNTTVTVNLINTTGPSSKNYTDSSTTLAAHTLGSNADLWSATITPAQVNSSAFGVTIQAKSTTSTASAEFIDNATVIVYYTNATKQGQRGYKMLLQVRTPRTDNKENS